MTALVLLTFKQDKDLSSSTNIKEINLYNGSHILILTQRASNFFIETLPSFDS